MTDLRLTIWRSSSSRQSAFDHALMSPRPNLDMGPGSAKRRDRTMLRIAGRTLHRVRDTRPQVAGFFACSSALAIERKSCQAIFL
jgi:hypothetical protein